MQSNHQKNIPHSSVANNFDLKSSPNALPSSLGCGFSPTQASITAEPSYEELKHENPIKQGTSELRYKLVGCSASTTKSGLIENTVSTQKALEQTSSQQLVGQGTTEQPILFTKSKMQLGQGEAQQHISVSQKQTPHLEGKFYAKEKQELWRLEHEEQQSPLQTNLKDGGQQQQGRNVTLQRLPKDGDHSKVDSHLSHGQEKQCPQPIHPKLNQNEHHSQSEKQTQEGSLQSDTDNESRPLPAPTQIQENIRSGYEQNNIHQYKNLAKHISVSTSSGMVRPFYKKITINALALPIPNHLFLNTKY